MCGNHTRGRGKAHERNPIQSVWAPCTAVIAGRQTAHLPQKQRTAADAANIQLSRECTQQTACTAATTAAIPADVTLVTANTWRVSLKRAQ